MALKVRILRAAQAGNRPASLEAGQIFIDEYQGVFCMRNASSASGILEFSLSQIATLAGQIGNMATQDQLTSGISTAIAALSFATPAQVDTAVAAGISGLVDGSPAAYDTLKEVFALAQSNADAQAALSSGQTNKADKSANLADLVDAGAARANLGLGELATLNLTDLVLDEGTV
jgi:hypothetical protein